jgi:hypothetical protein
MTVVEAEISCHPHRYVALLADNQTKQRGASSYRALARVAVRAKNGPPGWLFQPDPPRVGQAPRLDHLLLDTLHPLRGGLVSSQQTVSAIAEAVGKPSLIRYFHLAQSQAEILFVCGAGATVYAAEATPRLISTRNANRPPRKTLAALKDRYRYACRRSLPRGPRAMARKTQHPNHEYSGRNAAHENRF